MMKYILPLVLFSASLFASDPINPVTSDLPKRSDSGRMIQNELSTLTTLIDATEKNLKVQKQLKSEIEQYKDLQTKLIKDGENPELLFQVAKLANSIYTEIQDNHLSQTFSPEFMKEIKLFSQVSKKRGIPRPE